MDRKKNNKGIYNAFLYGVIGYAVVAAICVVDGRWHTAIAYLANAAICFSAWSVIKQLSCENDYMADMVDKISWISPNVKLPDTCERIVLLGEFSGSITETGGWYDTDSGTWHPDIKEGFNVIGWRHIE